MEEWEKRHLQDTRVLTDMAKVEREGPKTGVIRSGTESRKGDRRRRYLSRVWMSFSEDEMFLQERKSQQKSKESFTKSEK